MAFALKYLENLSGSGAGRKVFSYNGGSADGASDTKASIKAANYFDPAASLLTVGDRILIHATDADFDAHVSAISAAGAVTIAAVDGFV